MAPSMMTFLSPRYLNQWRLFTLLLFVSMHLFIYIGSDLYPKNFSSAPDSWSLQLFWQLEYCQNWQKLKQSAYNLAHWPLPPIQLAALPLIYTLFRSPLIVKRFMQHKIIQKIWRLFLNKISTRMEKIIQNIWILF
jgi:hypothetical protein